MVCTAGDGRAVTMPSSGHRQRSTAGSPGARGPTGGLRDLYPTSEVARILGVSAARVRALARVGGRPPRRVGRRFFFTFQDLVLLRTAHGLCTSRIPAHRIGRVLTELVRQLPAGRPLSGVRIYTDGDRVIAREGRSAWQPEDGQVVFSFAVDDLARTVRRASPPAPPAVLQPPPGAAVARRREAARCYDRGLVLEQAGHLRAAREAYARTLELDPTFADAHINLGRLLHEAGDPATAARHYEAAVRHAPDDAIAHYNLGVALEDLNRTDGAIRQYRRALEIDPQLAEAHFNLGRLLEQLNRPLEARLHFRLYERLTGREL